MRDTDRKKTRGRSSGIAAKQVVVTALMLLSALFLMALLMLGGDGMFGPDPDRAPQALESPPVPEQTAPLDHACTVRVKQADGTTAALPLDEYLWGVVAAEMPAGFEPQALAAQAAAARTYTLSRMNGQTPRHPEAQVCTDFRCCQAYKTREEAAAAWGERAEEYTAKIAAAVAETDGMVILYQDQPIQAVFFSSAAGRTTAAVEVWGNEVPYLTGVESPEGEGDVPKYHSEVKVSPEEFRQTFRTAHPSADLSGPPEQWLGQPRLNSAGGVAELTVGGVPVTGEELRRLFSLRSAHFTAAAGPEGVTFSVTGYGHGVGMSQYGANALAKEGKDWRAILRWYYTGVEIGPMSAGQRS